jgi:predicted nucleic-acid-binding protein
VIGLDTNVLIRYFVADDPKQSPVARELMAALSSGEPGWLGVVVLAELVWTLKYAYHFSRAGLGSIVEHLLSSKDIVIEQENLVREALLMYRKSNADYPDCLIAASARAAGCGKTVTFDKIAARDAGMELLS